MIIRRCKTKGALEAIPEKSVQLNLAKLKSKFETTTDLPILVMIKIDNYLVTCYKNGKLVIRNCNDEEEAKNIAEKIYEAAK